MELHCEVCHVGYRSISVQVLLLNINIVFAAMVLKIFAFD